MTGDKNTQLRIWSIIVGRVRYLFNTRYRRILWQYQADDVAAQVYAHLFANDEARLRSFDPAKGSLEAFVCRVAQNYLIDLARKHEPVDPLEDLAHDLVANQPSPEDIAAQNQLLSRLWTEFWPSLTPTEKIFVQYFYTDGHPYETIATLMNRTVASLHNLNSAVRAKAKACGPQPDG